MEMGSSYISSWRHASHGFGPELTNKTGFYFVVKKKKKKKKKLIDAYSQQQFPAEQYGSQLK